MQSIPEGIRRAMNQGALNYEVPKDMKVDTLRGYDEVCPPMQIMTWRGEGMPTGNENEPTRQHLWQQFVDRITAKEGLLGTLSPAECQERGEWPEEPVMKTVVFEQDGLFFDAGGFIIPEMMDLAGRMKAHKRNRLEQAKAAAKKAAADIMSEEGYDVSASDFTLEVAGHSRLTATDVVTNSKDGHHRPGDPVRPTPKLIDLKAWAQGHLNVHFFDVRKAFKEQHSFHVKDKADAMEKLVELGVIAG